MEYIQLSTSQIEILKAQGCKSLNGWENVFITPAFSTEYIHNVTFSGINYLGELGEKVSLNDSVEVISSISNAHINNCKIGNHVYINNIGTFISNYTIGDKVIIQNVNELSVEGHSSFGNGIKINTVNEAGGREVMMYDHLSAQTAYLLAFYRHNNKLIEQLENMIQTFSNTISSNTGIISEGVHISNTGIIRNVKIGPRTKIEGVTLLENGSINSTFNSPVNISHGVIAKNFIISSGTNIYNGASINHCFVGEACELGQYFTAEHSLFFANSEFLQGEACSIFAGPYTVSHHKSTLLIAGYYSFFNAGSGTNQSNHMYKLGPVHQGIICRGGKTGSDSYILWPAKIGVFTMVLGRHYSNPDTESLPFSYLIEDQGKSTLIPAQNLFSVGMTRDEIKWPKRDKRKNNTCLDYIHSEVLTPYTISKIITGISVLKDLQDKANSESRTLLYKNCQLSFTSINRGIKLYEQALIKYIGDELILKLKESNFTLTEQITQADTKWLDLSGLIIPEDKILNLISDLELGNLSLDQMNQFYREQYSMYKDYKFNHAISMLNSYFEIDINNKTQLIEFIEMWINNNEKIKNAIINDAKKEFNQKSMIGFGIDGNESDKINDFKLVRGTLENNNFIKEITLQFNEQNNFGIEIIQKLKNE